MSSRRLLSTSATSARRPEPPTYTGTNTGTSGGGQNSGSAKQLLGLGLGQLPQRGSSRLTSPNSSHRKLHMNGVHTNDLEDEGQNYYPYSARGEGPAKKSSFNFGHANSNNYDREPINSGRYSTGDGQSYYDTVYDTRDSACTRDSMDSWAIEIVPTHAPPVKASPARIALALNCDSPNAAAASAVAALNMPSLAFNRTDNSTSGLAFPTTTTTDPDTSSMQHPQPPTTTAPTPATGPGGAPMMLPLQLNRIMKFDGHEVCYYCHIKCLLYTAVVLYHTHCIYYYMYHTFLQDYYSDSPRLSMATNISNMTPRSVVSTARYSQRSSASYTTNNNTNNNGGGGNSSSNVVSSRNNSSYNNTPGATDRSLGHSGTCDIYVYTLHI